MIAVLPTIGRQHDRPGVNRTASGSHFRPMDARLATPRHAIVAASGRYDVAKRNIPAVRFWPTYSAYQRCATGRIMQERIRDVLAAHGRMPVDPHTVDSEADLYELGLTSYASVNVLIALEDAFGIEFPDEALNKSTFASVSAIEHAVERVLQSPA
jgi:acyl carrier protein